MMKFKEKLKKVFVPNKNTAPNKKLSSNQRKHVVSILQEVIYDKKSLTLVLESYQKIDQDKKELSLMKELCFGSLRWFYQLQAITNELLEKPLHTKHQDILCLIILGLYQILYTRIPDHAAVNETVATAKKINKPWASSLINKILRRFIKEKDDVLLKVNMDLQNKHAHPRWLIEIIQQAWPLKWQSILENNNQHPPMFLRVNTTQISIEEYRNKLLSKDIPTIHNPEYPNALKLDKPIPVSKLPGFSDGLCSLQDLSGQYVVELLDLKPAMNVLDTCAAPGSKSCHILEREPLINKLVAVDINANRLLKITENLQRLKLPNNKIKLVLDDATHTKQWWDGKLFDRILLDAPCSATGVIRRHPEIKILRQPKGIHQVAQMQQRLLRAMWPLLKKGGKLVYTTCSVLPQENQKAIETFISTIKDAKILPITFDGADSQQTKFGLQLFPQQDGADGFYYCVIEKK